MKNQTFGIETETTGIGRERTAKAIAAHFGTTARHIGLHLDDWKVPMPDGRHWTVERDGKVTIHKGFMNIEDFLAAVHAEQFTPQDSVVYHFRISTQAGVNAPMTHPFPLSNQLRLMRSLDLTCRCGVAHNGIIQLTSDPDNKRYSDTAIFITDYLSKIIRKKADLRDPVTLELIWQPAKSKFAIMDNSGYVATVGHFIDDHGLLFSNDSYQTGWWY